MIQVPVYFGTLYSSREIIYYCSNLRPPIGMKVYIWKNFPVNDFQKDKYQLILVYFLPREENKTF